jgi:Tfp pilus assembly protein PilF
MGSQVGPFAIRCSQGLLSSYFVASKKQKSIERGSRGLSRPAGATLLLAGVVVIALVLAVANLNGKKQNGISSPATAMNATATNGVAKEPDEITAELIMEANRDLEAKRANEAVAKLRKAIEIKPDEEDAHYNLGIALAATGKTAEARREYEKALEIFPDYGEAHNNLGNLLMSQNEFAEATIHFQKALEISPDNPTAHNNLGTTLARQGKVTEALPQFAEAIRLKGDYLQARLNLANGYITLSRFDEAAQELATILRMDPSFEPAQKAMARLRTRLPGGQTAQ